MRKANLFPQIKILYAKGFNIGDMKIILKFGPYFEHVLGKPLFTEDMSRDSSLSVCVPIYLHAKKTEC